MGIFDIFGNNKKKEKEATRATAKAMLHLLVNKMKADEEEERFECIKRPGSPDADLINVEIRFQGRNVAAPLYIYWMIKRLEDICSLEFEEVIRMLYAIDELLPEVTREQCRKEEERKADV